jgi:hypothetical protein
VNPVVIRGCNFSTTLTNNTVNAGQGIVATVIAPASTDGTTINASFVIAPNAAVGTNQVIVTVKAADGSKATTNPMDFVVTQAIPTNWTMASPPTNLNDGSLFFPKYNWSSTDGNKAHLSTCRVGETVFYPGFPTTPYIWPLPMVQSTTNPFSPTPYGYGSDDHAEDTNGPPGGYRQPYFASSFNATQRFWWTCPYYKNGSQNNFVPDITITRKIFKDTDGFWKYQISKSGYTNTFKLPNQ